MTITLHKGDIPADLNFGSAVAIDTEAMGLNPIRDRLCVVQLSAGDGNAHIVQLKADEYDAPNLKKLLQNTNVTKVFHFARYDVAIIWMYLNVLTGPIYCTKIASKLSRTFASHHSYRALCKDLLNIELNKQQQTSDWGAAELNDEQLEYAATDVFHLHKLKAHLDGVLLREGRVELAKSCFNFLPSLALLDIGGFEGAEVFEH